jgi:hypothetical protein
MTKRAVPTSRHGLAAALAIAAIAMLPILALLLPHGGGDGQAARLVVLLPPAAATLPQAASLLDGADARPLGQGAWPNLWLVASTDPAAVSRLYAAGARLVLAGDGVLAGCLGFSANAIRS